PRLGGGGAAPIQFSCRGAGGRGGGRSHNRHRASDRRFPRQSGGSALPVQARWPENHRAGDRLTVPPDARAARSYRPTEIAADFAVHRVGMLAGGVAAAALLAVTAAAANPTTLEAV